MAQIAVVAAATAATTLLTRASVTASLANDEKHPDHGIMKEEEVERSQYNEYSSRVVVAKNGYEMSQRFGGDDFYGQLDTVVSEIKQRSYEESDPVKKLQVEKIAASLETGGKYCRNDIQIKNTAQSMDHRIEKVKTYSNDPEMIEQLNEMKKEVNQIQRLNGENIQTTFDNAMAQCNDFYKIVNSPSLSPKRVKCEVQLLALEYHQQPESQQLEQKKQQEQPSPQLELQPPQVNQKELIGEEDLEEKEFELGTSIIDPSLINDKNINIQELEELEPGSAIKSKVLPKTQAHIQVPHVAWFLALAFILLRQLEFVAE